MSAMAGRSHRRSVSSVMWARDQRGSPNSEAPPFPMIAATPGMTSIALTAALLTSHRLMPNIMLEPEERRDVIAYILSLK